VLSTIMGTTVCDDARLCITEQHHVPRRQRAQLLLIVQADALHLGTSSSCMCMAVLSNVAGCASGAETEPRQPAGRGRGAAAHARCSRAARETEGRDAWYVLHSEVRCRSQCTAVLSSQCHHFGEPEVVRAVTNCKTAKCFPQHACLKQHA